MDRPSIRDLCMYWGVDDLHGMGALVEALEAREAVNEDEAVAYVIAQIRRLERERDAVNVRHRSLLVVLNDAGLLRNGMEPWQVQRTGRANQRATKEVVSAPLGMIVPGEYLPDGVLLDEDLGVADTAWRDRIPEPWEVEAHFAAEDSPHGGLWMAQNPNDTWIVRLSVMQRGYDHQTVMVDCGYIGHEDAAVQLEPFAAMRTRPVNRFGDTAAWPKRAVTTKGR